MNHLVSIIIPSYNHSDYITEAMESVFAQTYEKIELIIIDDGSQDDSLKKINEFKHAKNLKIISQENKGAPDAINRGIALSKGSFISILNSDDKYHTDRIEKCLEFLLTCKADLVFSDLDIIDSESRPDYGEKYELYKTLKANSEFLHHDDIFLQNNVAFTSSNFFFTKKLVRKIGLFRNLRYLHDWDWMLRCVAGGAYAWLREDLLSYRDHEINTIKENNLWKHMVENSFIIASHMMRWSRNRKVPLEDLVNKVFVNLMKSTSFYPIATLLFLWMLSGRYCTEDELLKKINDDDFMSRFIDIAENNGYDLRTILPPDYMNNFFKRERSRSVIIRIIKKILSIP